MPDRVSGRLLVSVALIASIALATAASAAAITVSGTLSSGDPIRSVAGPGTTVGNCATPPVAGSVNSFPFPYDVYSFVNTSASAQCVTVAVTAASPSQLFIQAYTAGSNYVSNPTAGLIGASDNFCLAAGSSMQFTVTAGQSFLVVVSSCTGNTELPVTYTVEVTGTGITGGTQVAAVLRGAPTATARGTGVAVQWRTASEVDLLGFNVYRERNGRRVRVNARLLAAHGAGAYSFLDPRAPRARPLRYWIQAVNLDGTRQWYGPARLTRP